MGVPALQAFNDYALISLGVAGVYFTASVALVALGAAVRKPGANSQALSRPGETVHQALKHAGRRWDAWTTAALLFGVSLVLLLEFGRRDLFGPLPLLLNALIAAGIAIALVSASVRMWRLRRYRAKLSGLLSLHNDMARRLVEVQLRGNRVFSSVALEQFCLDHVVIGADGVYAVQLILPPDGTEAVKRVGNELVFGPGAERKSTLPFRAAVVELKKLLRTELGLQIDVHPVIVVPGCRIHGDQSDDLLVVNLQSCAAFIGWRKGECFLHSEDLGVLSAWVGERCCVRLRGGLAAAAARLQQSAGLPATI